MPDFGQGSVFADYLNNARQSLQTPAPVAPSTPEATGTGNWLTAGLGSGFHEALANAGYAGQAVAQKLGFNGAADTAEDWARSQTAAAQGYARPDLEASPWSFPGMAYKIAQGLPTGAGALAAGSLAALAAPETAGAGVLGGAAFMLPQSIGGNVQRQIDERGYLSEPGKAIALGVPEAALQGILPGHIEGKLAGGAIEGAVSRGVGSLLGEGAGKIAQSAVTGVGIQAGAGAATVALTQQMGDPNRSFADRANEILQAALSGGLQGAVFGGAMGAYKAATGALTTKPAADVSTGDLDNATRVLLPAPPIRGVAPIQDLSDADLIQRESTLRPLAQPGTPQGDEHAKVLAEVARRGGQLPDNVSNGALVPSEGTTLPSTNFAPNIEQPDNATTIPMGGPEDEQARIANMLRNIPTPVLRAVSSNYDQALANNEPMADNHSTNNQLVKAELAARDAAVGRTPVQGEFDFSQPDPTQQTELPLKGGNFQPNLSTEGPPAEPFKVGNEGEPSAFSWTQRRRELAKATSKMPPQFTNKDFQSEDELHQFIADTVNKYDANNKQVPAGLQAWAKATGVMGDDGQLAGKFAKEPPTEVVPPTPAGLEEPAQAAPSVRAQAPLSTEAVPEQHQARAQNIQKINDLIDSVANDPDTMALKSRAASLMTSLTKVEARGQNSASAIDKRTRALQADVEAKLGGAQPAVEPPAVEPTQPASPDLAPSPKAQQITDQAIAKRSAPEAPVKQAPPKTQAEAQARKSTPATTPAPTSKISKAITAAQGALDSVKSHLSETAQGVVDKAAGFADQAKQRILAGDSEKRDATIARATQRNLDRAQGQQGEIEKALARHQTALDQISEALKNNDTASLARFAANEKHFDSSLWDLSDTLPGADADLIQEHMTAEEKVFQALRDLTGGKARVDPTASGLPVSQLDADVFHMARNGVPLRDIIDHVIENHPDSDLAELAAKVRPHLSDETTIARSDTTGKLGSYSPGLRTAAIYEPAGAAQTIIHEAVHAVTHAAIDGRGPAGVEIRNIHAQLEGNGYRGLADPHEMVAEAFSNPRFRDFLKSQIVGPNSLWDRLVNAVRSVLGLTPNQTNALDRIMGLGDDLFKENKTVPNPDFQQDSYYRVADAGLNDVSKAADTIRQQSADMLLGLRENVRKYAIGWADGHNMSEAFKRPIPSMPKYVDLQRQQDVRSATFSRLSTGAQRLVDNLKHGDQTLLNKVMAYTALRIDPPKSFAAHEHLSKRPEMAALVKEANDDFNKLRRVKGGVEAYEALRAKHSAELMASLSQYTKFVSDMFQGGVPGVNDEVANYMNRTDLHADPMKAEGFWRDALTKQLAALDRHRNTTNDTRAGYVDRIKNPAQFPGETIDPDQLKQGIKRLTSDYDLVTDFMKGVTKSLKESQDAPYFHLGRNGSHFVSGELQKDALNGIDQVKLNKLQQRLAAAGFGDVAIMQGMDNPSVYMRVRDASEMAALHRVVAQAEKDGLLKTGSVGVGDASNPKIFNGISPAALRRAMDQIEARGPAIPMGANQETIDWLRTAHSIQMRDLKKTVLDMLPENSMGKLMARREYVQGFEKDMVANSQRASAIVAGSVGKLSLTRDVGITANEMLDQVRANNHDPNVSLNDKLAGSQAVSEMMMREQLRQNYVPDTPLTWLRHLTHTLHIGSSPAYFLTMMSQIGTMTLPELARTHGFARSAQMIYNNTPKTFQILKAVAKGEDYLQAGITQEALEKAKIPPADVKFIMGQVARGDFGIGMYSPQMLSGEHHGMFNQGKPKQFKDAMNAIGFYAELTPRVITALAARDLYNAKPRAGMTMEEFVSHVVKESQGDWTASLNARQLGRGGMFGAMSPLINQFMGWQVRMTSKLYREVAGAVGGDKESQRWVMGHLAAVTMLAGTLGAPLLSTFASVYDRLADMLTGTDDHDLTASYRTFLANTFGKDAGEIIARGLPRAVGADFDHWGEGSIVPGSSTVNALFEKRKWEDAQKDWFKSMAGSALGTASNFVSMGRDILNGDVMDGLIKVAPEFAKTPMEGYRLAQRGFVDKNGVPVPITANGFDVAMTALGIDPGKEAEYAEVKREQTGLNTMRQLREQNISRHLIMAQERQDPAMFQKWEGEAQQYMADHPGLTPPMAEFGRAFSEHLRNAMVARQLGLPTGVSPRDIAGRGALSYGNFGN